MSLGATPAPLIASITFLTAALFFSSASVDVAPWVSTPNENSAVSGVALTIPTPVTVIPSGPPPPVVWPFAPAGARTPA